MKTSRIIWRTVMIALFSIGSSISVAFAAGAETLYGDWPAVNINGFNLNVAPDTVLKASNIANIVNIDPNNLLGLISFNNSFDSSQAVNSTPVIADGIVYYATGGGVLKAVKVDGTQLHPACNLQLTIEDNTTHEYFDSSPVLTKDFVFVAGRMMHKINRATCTEIAKHLYSDNTTFTNATFNNDPTSVFFDQILASQVMIAGDKVIYAIGYNDEGGGGTTAISNLYPVSHGMVIAYNQSDLSIAWSIDLSMIGSDGKPTSTVFGPGISSFGGGGVDPVRHLFFIGTGNQYSTAPPSGPLPTVSPISDSLLAINYDTGKIVWFYQYQNHDTWGGAGSDTSGNGKRDTDVSGHPQIFSVQLIPGLPFTSIDLVGSRGKDGTYRIFTRDQIPGHVLPIAQVLADPTTLLDGGIQFDPVINNGILYLGSIAVIDSNLVHNSLDFYEPLENPFGLLNVATTTFRAIDLQKLVVYGIGQLLSGNTTTPVCLVPASKLNPNVTLSGSPSCTGLLPSNIVKWTTPITPMLSVSSSGMTYDNGVLIQASTAGEIHLINAATGAVISTPNPLVPAPLVKYLDAGTAASYNSIGLKGIPTVGGISAVNGKLFVPVGIFFPAPVFAGNPLTLFGGIVIYQLP